MPLSDHEQRLLDQIERALYAEDPKFANSVRSTSPQVHYKRRLVKAGLGFFLGICLLMTGVVGKIIPLGVVGFVVMLGFCVWGLSSWKRMTGVDAGDGGAAATGDGKAGGKPEGKAGGKPGGKGSGKRSSRQSRPGFMSRIEDRWRRREDGGDR